MASTRKRQPSARKMREIVRAAEPILRRLRGFDSDHHSLVMLLFLAQRACSDIFEDEGGRPRTPAEQYDYLDSLVSSATGYLQQAAEDVAALAALMGDTSAPAYREQHAPESTAEAVDWLRRQIDGLGKA